MLVAQQSIGLLVVLFHPPGSGGRGVRNSSRGEITTLGLRAQIAVLEPAQHSLASRWRAGKGRGGEAGRGQSAGGA